MRNPMRTALRLALAGWLGLAGLSLVAAQGRAATPPEKLLPESTIAYLKVNNAAALASRSGRANSASSGTIRA